MILFLAALLAPLPWVAPCQINPVTEPMAGGWIRVRHADGATGYVRVNQVWGI